MESPEKPAQKMRQLPRPLVMGFICFLVLATGFMGMSRLAASKTGPVPKAPLEKRLTVTTLPIQKQTVAIRVNGYGQVAPIHLMEICPEISGKIIEVNEHLEQGEIIRQGDVLFRLNPIDYEIQARKAAIAVSLKENQLAQLRVEFRNDQARLSSVKRNTLLANAEFSRLKLLYETEQVGTRTGMEAAEQSYNSLLDTEKTLVKALELYPLEMGQAQSDIADASSDLKTARLNVERSVIKAPFTGRIKEKSIENGMYISKGTTALILADDSILEILVPLSDRDAFDILNFRKNQNGEYVSAGQKNCQVQALTGRGSAFLSGVIDRAVKYDSDSRTLYLAVRVAQEAISESKGLLMDGMFCRVTLTGAPVKDLIKIPKSALNQDNNIYLARNSRLKTLGVTVVMEEGEDTYISGVFDAQDRIIVTQLTHPIENQGLILSTAKKEVANIPGETDEQIN